VARFSVGFRQMHHETGIIRRYENSDHSVIFAYSALLSSLGVRTTQVIPIGLKGRSGQGIFSSDSMTNGGGKRAR
jgi:hypothetical protein